MRQSQLDNRDSHLAFGPAGKISRIVELVKRNIVNQGSAKLSRAKPRDGGVERRTPELRFYAVK